MNNNGPDQSARMRRLVCAFVVRNPPKTGFLASWPVLWASTREFGTDMGKKPPLTLKTLHAG